MSSMGPQRPGEPERDPGTIADAEFADRLQRLRAGMAASGLDALIAYSTASVQANVRYLADYSALLTGVQGLPDATEHMFGSCACFVTLDGEPVLLIDQPWDVERARQVSRIADVRYASVAADDLGPSIRRAGSRRVGIDNWHLFPAEEYLALVASAPGVSFEPSRILTELRRVKSEAEIALIRQAAALADEAVAAVLDSVRPGASEYEIVLRCEEVMRTGGDIQLGAGTIGGCGSSSSTGSSMPVRDAGRTIARGEWMLLDVCPRVGVYCGDIARARLAGDPSDLDDGMQRIASATVLINEEVRKAVRPGISGRRLNELASEVAREEGVLGNKTDLLGHGIGLDVVDAPSFYFDDSPLSIGEVVTVEPCLLIPGVAGLRIEDMVLVTEGGGETLTSMDRGVVPG
jgi:Xaa-Pro aminopeptidase